MHAEPLAQLDRYLFQILHAPILVSIEAQSRDLVVIVQESSAKQRDVPQMSKQSASSCGIGVAECYRGTCGCVVDVHIIFRKQPKSLSRCRQTATGGVLRAALKHIFSLQLQI